MIHNSIKFNGKDFADKKLLVLKNKIAKTRIKPHLEIILVGDDPASIIYTNLKTKKGKQIGACVNINKLSKDTSEEQIIDLIKSLNNNPQVHGILIQLPLPKNINTQKVLSFIKVTKDVDGLNPKSSFTPATVSAILAILHSHYPLSI